ncbi:enoyl-CoA hydratase/isomerase family protein [Lysobacter ciconiae]|uniref:Enoyl-CoA hydratase/isomerase family protein n=1 Tax=Novilysobacter ciconiae TaxID=2781022 RepID=A0A7S6UEN7_9GAMM|nr:enoyl-CoA hydratase/isomerase family protein [Lysobacter ciconiae]QOW18834.1 enoyl-CoA hydratase/isomerase family protein [Lysobacter ciconiae]
MSHVKARVHGDVVELQLARPPVNALDPALCRELHHAVTSAISEGARGIVLAGAPRIFSAGLDVPYLLSLGDDRKAISEAWQAFFGAARALAASTIPVVAAITGHAPAGGCVYALCCDYRIMASGDFRIGLNETRVGLVAPEGVQRLMRRVVGAHRAERLLVAGDMVDADTALRFGLVDELVDMGPEHDTSGLLARAHEWLGALLALPHDAMRHTREIARAEVIEALQPEHIGLEVFVDAWFEPGTQDALKALVARLGKK